MEKHFEAINKIVSNGMSLVVAENMILGTDHAEIGAQILAQWSFPSDIVNAVRFHHNPDMMHNRDILNDLLYLANLFCQMNGARYGNTTNAEFIYPALKERLGIAQDKLESISNQIAGWVNDISANLIFDE